MVQLKLLKTIVLPIKYEKNKIKKQRHLTVS